MPRRTSPGRTPPAPGGRSRTDRGPDGPRRARRRRTSALWRARRPCPSIGRGSRGSSRTIGRRRGGSSQVLLRLYEPPAGAEQPYQDRLLHVEAVLRLVEDDRARAVEDAVRDLLPAVGGQAVHHEGVLL